MFWKYVLAAGILLAAELLYFRVAERLGIVDRPNARSSHTKTVLRGGGVIFTVGAWVWAALFGAGCPWWFLSGLTLIAGISFADDIRPLPDSLRLGVQFAAVLLLLRQLGLLEWQLWWLAAAGCVVSVGIINVYNFMDGVNGMTGGYSLAVLLPLLYLDGRLGFAPVSLPAVAALSAAVFCLFNFRPRNRARCFAGDVGSVGMAYIMVYLLGSLIVRTGDVSWLMLLSVYGVDAVLTIGHRILLHENLGTAHRKHAYQLLANELGWSHVAVSLLYAGVQLAVSAGLVLLPDGRYLYSAAVLVLLCAAYLLFMRRYYPLHAAYLTALKKQG